MTTWVPARVVFAVTALAVLTGVVVQLWSSIHLTGTQFTSRTALAVNVFCYFTVQSNVIVMVTTAALALRPDRPSTVFRVARLTGVVAITITFVVFHVALAGLQDLTGAAALANLLLHTVVPVLAVGGWLVFGPRRATSGRIAALTLVFPFLWSVLALVRGTIVDFYPYPFVDVRVLGYPRVLVNMLLVGVLFIALSSVAVLADRRLPGGRGAGRAD